MALEGGIRVAPRCYSERCCAVVRGASNRTDLVGGLRTDSGAHCLPVAPNGCRRDAACGRAAVSTKQAAELECVIWRFGLTEGEPKYDGLEKRLAEGPVITVPTITLVSSCAWARRGIFN